MFLLAYAVALLTLSPVLLGTKHPQARNRGWWGPGCLPYTLTSSLCGKHRWLFMLCCCFPFFLISTPISSLPKLQLSPDPKGAERTWATGSVFPPRLTGSKWKGRSGSCLNPMGKWPWVPPAAKKLASICPFCPHLSPIDGSHLDFTEAHGLMILHSRDPNNHFWFTKGLLDTQEPSSTLWMRLGV